MKKVIFYILCVLFISTISSCKLLAVIIDIGTVTDTVSSNNKDNDIIGNVQIYIENKTDEIIVVFAKLKRTIYEKGNENMEIDLARIPKGKMKKINVKKGMEIYIIGGHTQRKYREIVCDIDQETIVIY